MMFRPWWVNEKLSTVSIYNPKNNAYPDNVRLSKIDKNDLRLSPVTEFVLNVFTNLIDENNGKLEKNLVVAAPNCSLKVIPLLSYIFSTLTQKSVLVIPSTSESVNNHRKNYYLMNEHNGRYLFQHLPLGIVKKDHKTRKLTAEVKFYLPRANKRLIKNFKDEQISKFFNPSLPKLVFLDDRDSRDNYNMDLDIITSLNEIIFDDKEPIPGNIMLNLGLVIFECLDYVLTSKKSYEAFMDWIEHHNKEGLSFVFHYSKIPTTINIDDFKKRTNSLVAPFEWDFLRNCEKLREESLEYFKHFESNDQGFNNEKADFPLLEVCNIDERTFYDFSSQIRIYPPLEKGNIYMYLNRIRSNCKKIKDDYILNKYIYYNLKNFVYLLPNLLVNPGLFKVPYFDGKWRYLSIENLIEIFYSELDNEKNENIRYLYHFIIDTYSLYNELKMTKRIMEEDSYSRESKSYYLWKVMSEIDENKVVVGTYTKYERSLINRLFKKIKSYPLNKEDTKKDKLSEFLVKISSKSLEMYTLEELLRQPISKDEKDKCLILPGPIPRQILGIFNRPYKKIIILTYEGKNLEYAKYQKKALNEHSNYHLYKLLEYVGDIYNHFELTNPFVGCTVKEDSTNLESDTNETIKDIEDMLKQLDDTNNKIKEASKKIVEKITHTHGGYLVKLKGLKEDSIVERMLPLMQSYIYIRQEKIKKGYPRDLKKGDLILLLGGEVRKSLLDVIIEMFDLKREIDEFLLNLWNMVLSEYYNKNGQSYKKMWEAYKKEVSKINGHKAKKYQTFRNWVVGNVIAPEDKMDIYCVGKMLKNEVILAEYEKLYEEAERLRYLHRVVGRKINSILVSIIGDKHTSRKLSYEDYQIFNYIDGNIYEIISIDRRD